MNAMARKYESLPGPIKNPLRSMCYITRSMWQPFPPALQAVRWCSSGTALHKRTVLSISSRGTCPRFKVGLVLIFSSTLHPPCFFCSCSYQIDGAWAASQCPAIGDLGCNGHRRGLHRSCGDFLYCTLPAEEKKW